MGMLCSILRIDDRLLQHLRADEELIVGVTSLALKRHHDEIFELTLQQRSREEQARARTSRQEREKQTLARIPERFATEVARQRELRERATQFEVNPALSLHKSWDALEHLFALAGGSLFRGQPIGPNQGYGPALLRTPKDVSDFSMFLDGDGRTQVLHADMRWLREQKLYGWPDVDDDTESDDVLARGLINIFEDLRSYVSRAANNGDALLVWIS